MNLRTVAGAMTSLLVLTMLPVVGVAAAACESQAVSAGPNQVASIDACLLETNQSGNEIEGYEATTVASAKVCAGACPSVRVLQEQHWYTPDNVEAQRTLIEFSDGAANDGSFEQWNVDYGFGTWGNSDADIAIVRFHQEGWQSEDGSWGYTTLAVGNDVRFRDYHATGQPCVRTLTVGGQPTQLDCSSGGIPPLPPVPVLP